VICLQIEFEEKGVHTSSQMNFHEPTQFAKEALFFVEYTGRYNVNKDYKIDRNYFNTFILFLIKKGKMYFEYDGRSFNAKKDEIVLIDCKKSHLYTATGPVDFKWSYFSGISSQAYYDMIYNKFGNKLNFINFSIEGSMDIIFDLMKGKEVPEHQISVEVHRILSKIVDYEQRKNKESSIAQEAIVFMENNFNKNILLDDIAEKVNLSTYYFARVFKKNINVTPHNYLLNIRIREAKRLLISTDYSVEKISTKCGFNSTSHFIRSFKKRVNTTPHQFRQTKF
jgi:AraC-like DNA-binding protein